MEQPWKITELEIIGYADVLSASMRPSVVPPVFRSVQDKQIVLVPPYELHEESVAGATRIPMSEAHQLSDRNEITLLQSPIPAVEGYELWVDPAGVLRYQLLETARGIRGAWADEAIQRAVAELERPDADIQMVEQAAEEAIRCDQSRPAPYAIKAAVRRWQRNPVGMQLMQEMGYSICDRHEFDFLIDGYYSRIGRTRPELVDRPSASPMTCMALEDRKVDAA